MSNRIEKIIESKREIPMGGDGAAEDDWSSINPTVLAGMVLDYDEDEEMTRFSRLPHRLKKVLGEEAEAHAKLNEELDKPEQEVLKFLDGAIEASAKEIVANKGKGKEIYSKLLKTAAEEIWRLKEKKYMETAALILEVTKEKAAKQSEKTVRDAETLAGNENLAEDEQKLIARQLFKDDFAQVRAPHIKNALLKALEALQSH